MPRKKTSETPAQLRAMVDNALESSRQAAKPVTPAQPARIEAAQPFPTVAAYFAARLGDELHGGDEQDPGHPGSPYHPDFHIETGCGLSCRDAIDSAANLIRHLRAAFGDSEEGYRDAIVNATREIVLCYVYG